ncbi:MAG TPA: glycine cleavage T C-terminal barrel domain-containing protein [Fimbriimonadaceae bacterium]|nr:glycine cleavage T C-terminal barrel domain-containing protein [Fimbriimonadaceae bacterium]
MTPSHLAESKTAEYDLLREDCGLIELTDRLALVRLTGDDRKAWLQGQVTNDVRALQVGGFQSFCFLTPTGQILADCSCWRTEDSYLIAVDVKALNALIERFDAMIVMEQVEYSVVSGEYRMFSLQGPSASQRLGELLDLPTLDIGSATLGKVEVTLLRSNRTGMGGWDSLVPASSKTGAKPITSEFTSVSEGAFNAAMLEAGIPRYGFEIDGKTLPPELGLAFMNRNVSHNKGCYTGQEVVHRIHARGHTNKTWVGILADDMMVPGDQVVHGTKEVGTVISAFDSPRFGYIASAFVKNDVINDGEEVEIRRENDAFGGEIRELPLLRF